MSRQQIFQTIGSHWNGQLAQAVFYLVNLIIFMCIMHLSVVFDIYVKTSHRYWYTKIQQVISKVYTFLTLYSVKQVSVALCRNLRAVKASPGYKKEAGSGLTVERG